MVEANWDNVSSKLWPQMLQRRRKTRVFSNFTYYVDAGEVLFALVKLIARSYQVNLNFVKSSFNSH